MTLDKIKKSTVLWAVSSLVLGATVLLPGQVHASGTEQRQILINPDFSQPLGWFRAMMPHRTEGLKAGVEKDEKGLYLYLEQKGVKGQLFNNWAQRIEKAPIGAKMRLEAEVATRNAADKGGVILLMFFDKDGKILGVTSSEGKVNLMGTKPWTKVKLDAVVPENCDCAIVRLGLKSTGKIMVRYAQLFLQNGESFTSAAGSDVLRPVKDETRRQILVNPDFRQDPVLGNPPGWFRAMMPRLTQGFKAGLKRDREGPYLYLQQKGVKGQLFNNWAQRIEKPPIGAKMQLETEVATQNARNNGAIIMLMFFDKSGKMLGGASSEARVDLTRTKPWTKVKLDAVVPKNCDVAIVRLGLSSSGKIKVRYARLYLQQ